MKCCASPRLGECVTVSVASSLAMTSSDRDVVGGVVRDLPHQGRTDRVEDELATQIGAHALVALLDSHLATMIAHQALLLPTNAVRTPRTNTSERWSTPRGSCSSINTASVSLSSRSRRWPNRRCHSTRPCADGLPDPYRQRWRHLEHERLHLDVDEPGRERACRSSPSALLVGPGDPVGGPIDQNQSSWASAIRPSRPGRPRPQSAGR